MQPPEDTIGVDKTMTRQNNVLLLDACPGHFLVRVRGIRRWQEIVVHTAALQCHHLRVPHRQELRDARDGADGYPDARSSFLSRC